MEVKEFSSEKILQSRFRNDPSRAHSFSPTILFLSLYLCILQSLRTVVFMRIYGWKQFSLQKKDSPLSRVFPDMHMSNTLYKTV
jgi:hypothetical protein